ncbi:MULTISPECIES: arabinose transporter [Pseudomonas]|uniref:arabinose transporter n=1 Tax=Pseudomonas TaxID=286 RepID=UPI0018E8A85E|nr:MULTISPECIES: arabinose transporter [Pseudomonas]MBJ2350366.1 arabinose transporter [Pseudomonas canavaninivorans]MBL3545526.1 arabinose transporter [Pseudomonas sp. HB05]
MTQENVHHGAAPAPQATVEANPVLRLLPLTLTVFIGFLPIGLQLPVLPLHLHDTLGMGTWVIGLVVGAQFAAALLSRAWAGNFADMRGGKRAVMAGLVTAAVSALVYLLSLAFVATPVLSVWLLLVGRVLLAVGESLVVTGALGWGIGLVGPQHAGKVMAWNGIAMYGAYALGAPFGVALNSGWGFMGIVVASMFIPLLALAVVAGVRAVAPMATRRTPFYKMLGAVWVPGMGLAFCSVGFGVVTAFIALLFAARDWGNASLAFTAFGLAFIGARLLFGHLPDRIGGARVALVCVVIEAVGLLLIWDADTAFVAYVGAAFTGFGYSLAFPGFGVEAVRRAPPQSRGLAMGAYVAFLDISLGITSPLAGVLASGWGIEAVYLGAAVAVALSFGVALMLLGSREIQVQYKS